MNHLLNIQHLEIPIYHYCEHGAGWYKADDANNCPCAETASFIKTHQINYDPDFEEKNMQRDYDPLIIWLNAKRSFDKQYPGYHFTGVNDEI